MYVKRNMMAVISVRTKWRWVLCSTAESNDLFRLELPRTWELSVNSSVARIRATVGSQFSFFIGN